MFRRLTIIATDFKKVGAEYVDDAWIKRKYVNALVPFESTNLNSVKGRESYHRMTSTKVMQEIFSFKMATKLDVIQETGQLECLKVAQKP